MAANFGFKRAPFCFDVSMAQTNNKVEVHTLCQVDLKLFGSSYKNVQLYVMKNLCVDILLGRDILGLHKQVIFKFGGNRDKLVVPNQLCAVVVADVKTPELFGNLTSGWKPIATKSRRYNLEDKEFIRTTVAEWKAAGTVRKSNSPW